MCAVAQLWWRVPFDVDSGTNNVMFILVKCLVSHTSPSPLPHCAPHLASWHKAYTHGTLALGRLGSDMAYAGLQHGHRAKPLE